MNIKDKYPDTKGLIEECMDLASDWDVDVDEEFILRVLLKSMDKRFSFWQYEVNSVYSYYGSENDTAGEMLDFD